MALTDIVYHPSTWDMEEARGNSGVLVDICAKGKNALGALTVELARGSVAINDVVSTKLDQERPRITGPVNVAF